MSYYPEDEQGEERIIVEKFDILTSSINPELFCDKLREAKHFSAEDTEEILCKARHPGRKSRARTFLELLITKGPDAINTFLNLLQYEYPHVYKRVTGKCAVNPPPGYEPNPEGRMSQVIEHLPNILLEMNMQQRSKEDILKLLKLAQNEKIEQEIEIEQLKYCYEENKRLEVQTDDYKAELCHVRTELENYKTRYLHCLQGKDELNTKLIRAHDEKEKLIRSNQALQRELVSGGEPNGACNLYTNSTDDLAETVAQLEKLKSDYSSLQHDFVQMKEKLSSSENELSRFTHDKLNEQRKNSKLRRELSDLHKVATGRLEDKQQLEESCRKTKEEFQSKLGESEKQRNKHFDENIRLHKRLDAIRGRELHESSNPMPSSVSEDATTEIILSHLPTNSEPPLNSSPFDGGHDNRSTMAVTANSFKNRELQLQDETDGVNISRSPGLALPPVRATKNGPGSSNIAWKEQMGKPPKAQKPTLRTNAIEADDTRINHGNSHGDVKGDDVAKPDEDNDLTTQSGEQSNSKSLLSYCISTKAVRGSFRAGNEPEHEFMESGQAEHDSMGSGQSEHDFNSDQQSVAAVLSTSRSLPLPPVRARTSPDISDDTHWSKQLAKPPKPQKLTDKSNKETIGCVIDEDPDHIRADTVMGKQFAKPPKPQKPTDKSDQETIGYIIDGDPDHIRADTIIGKQLVKPQKPTAVNTNIDDKSDMGYVIGAIDSDENNDLYATISTVDMFPYRVADEMLIPITAHGKNRGKEVAVSHEAMQGMEIRGGNISGIYISNMEIKTDGININSKILKLSYAVDGPRKEESFVHITLEEAFHLLSIWRKPWVKDIKMTIDDNSASLGSFTKGNNDDYFYIRSSLAVAKDTPNLDKSWRIFLVTNSCLEESYYEAMPINRKNGRHETKKPNKIPSLKTLMLQDNRKVLKDDWTNRRNRRRTDKPNEDPYVKVIPIRANKKFPVILFGMSSLVWVAMETLRGCSDFEVSDYNPCREENESRWIDWTRSDQHVVFDGSGDLVTKCQGRAIYITLIRDNIYADEQPIIPSHYSEVVHVSDVKDGEAIRTRIKAAIQRSQSELFWFTKSQMADINVADYESFLGGKSRDTHK